MAHLRRQWIRLAGLLAITGLLVAQVGCSSGAGSTPASNQAASNPASSNGASVKPVGQTSASGFVAEPGKMPPPPGNGKNYSDEEWAKIVEAAKKEGKVMHYGNLGADQDPALIAAFKKAYGIDVEIVAGNTNQLAERIKNEYRGNVYQVDAIWGQGSVQVGQLEDLLAPIDINPVFRNANSLNEWYVNPLVSPVVHQSHAYPACGHLTINTDIVPPDKYPKKPQDLLDPFFKGKVIMQDPQTSITPITTIWGWHASLGYPDWFLDWAYDLFDKNNGYVVIAQDTNRALANGEGAVYLAMRGTTGGTVQDYAENKGVKNMKVLEFSEAPIPCSSTIMMGFSVFKKAPHPNAARLWSDWFIGKDGQTVWANAQATSTIRRDVPNPVKEQYRPKPEANKYWDIDIDWMFFMNEAFTKKIIFRLTKEGMSREEFKNAIKQTSIDHFGSYPPPPRKFYSAEEFYGGFRK
jgi:iron(III) transport system substrate-binding protein